MLRFFLLRFLEFPLLGFLQKFEVWLRADIIREYVIKVLLPACIGLQNNHEESWREQVQYV